MNRPATESGSEPFIKPKRVGVLVAICLGIALLIFAATAVFVQAASSTKINSTDGFADGNEITRTVTFNSGDFAAGAKVSEVTLTVELEKVDNACGDYQGGPVFNREMFMKLRSPDGTEVALIESLSGGGGSNNIRTYSSNNAYNGQVTITFDDAAPSQVGGPAPVSGTFRPEEPLAGFFGDNPVGDWVLTIGDDNANEPHCFYEISLTVDADQPPVADDQTMSVAENSPNGTGVGTVVWSDGDVDDKVTFAEIGGTGTAVFEINSSLGAISVTDSAQLDFENPAQDQYTYIVELTDSGGLTDTAIITINVTDANDTPTAIGLAPNDVDEHQPAGTAVGTLSTTDQDASDTHSYALVSGAGDDDNASFALDGDGVETAVSLDYESQITYTIRVQTSDGNGGTFAQPLTITVNDGNDPPTDITLSSNEIAENQPIGSSVGTFSTTDPNPDTPVYTLVSGAGDTDNGSFTIVGNELRSNAVFDFEGGQTSYAIRVESDDQNGGTFEKTFTINVTDENDAATNFTLDDNTILENQIVGTTVGSFAAVDTDGGTYTYTLVAGAGDGDNGDFAISGDELVTAVSFNYETQITYTIRVQQDDGIGQIERQFDVVVQNENEAPTDVALSNDTIEEHRPIGTTVGNLSNTDPDTGDSHTYSLVAGAGDDDNADFSISGSQLRVAADLDYETAVTRTVRIQVRDAGGLTFAESFIITLTDGNDPPTDIALSGSQTITENLASGMMIGTLSATDPNGDMPITYTLPAGTPDNSAFQIVGTELRSATSFDYETKDTYNINIQADDGNGGTYQEPFTITIIDGNDAPTAVVAVPPTFVENLPISSTITTLDATDQDSAAHTFTLVAGPGDDDNGLFNLVGDELQTTTLFDYETDPRTYTIRVHADDTAGGTFTQAVLLTLTDGNDAPTDFSLDNSSFDENLAIGSEVASLSVTDQDSGDFHSFALVAGAGDDDNGLFQFTDEILETAALFDFETDPPTYTIRIETSDGAGGFFTKTVTLTLNDVNDPPIAAPDFGGTIDEDSILMVTAVSGVLANDSDQDGDPFSVVDHSTLSADGGLVMVQSDGAFSYDPRGVAGTQSLGAGDSLTDSFTYIVEDDGGMSSTGTVTLTVTGVNDAPVANHDSVFTQEAQPVIIAVLDNDTDIEGDTLSINDFTQGGEGAVTDNGDGTLTYTPDSGFVGQDSFTYTVSDGNGGVSLAATVDLSVGEVKLYLPTLVNSFAPPAPAPDLVVTSVAATADEVTVVIANVGTAVTDAGFWVDFYIDPSPVPTAEGQTWFDVADEGIVWGIDVPLAPNETLTLTYSTDPSAPNLFYSANDSSFSGSLPAGTPIYAQVDSAHLGTTYGGVLESHEIEGEPYNNISDEFFATAP